MTEKKKYNTITTMDRDHSGKSAVKTIEMRCRAALSEYKDRSKNSRRMGEYFQFFFSNNN